MKINRFKLFFACVMGCALCLSTACSDDKNGLEAPTVTVSQFSPESALPGTELVVTGSNFGEEGRVFFNETEATDYISRSATEIHPSARGNSIRLQTWSSGNPCCHLPCFLFKIVPGIEKTIIHSLRFVKLSMCRQGRPSACPVHLYVYSFGASPCSITSAPSLAISRNVLPSRMPWIITATTPRISEM